MPWGLAARCRPASTGQGTGARQWTWETAPRARRHEGTRPPPAATSTCPHGGEPAPGEEQVRGPGCRAAAQREPGLGRVAGPSVGRARGLRTPGAPLPRRPAVLAQPSVPLHLGSFQKTRSSWPQTCGNQPTRRLRHRARPPRLRHLLQVGRVGVPRARSASGPRGLSPRAALEPGAAKWPPLTRVSAAGPPRFAFQDRARPPAHGPRARSGPYSRPPTGWPLRPAPAWPCPRRFSGCVLLLQAPPAGGRGTGSGRDALGTEPHRLVSPAASCCPGLRCD